MTQRAITIKTPRKITKHENRIKASNNSTQLVKSHNTAFFQVQRMRWWMLTDSHFIKQTTRREKPSGSFWEFPLLLISVTLDGRSCRRAQKHLEEHLHKNIDNVQTLQRKVSGTFFFCLFIHLFCLKATMPPANRSQATRIKFGPYGYRFCCRPNTSGGSVHFRAHVVEKLVDPASKCDSDGGTVFKIAQKDAGCVCKVK